ncbi:MAG: class I SAM-dependent methyltransferase [Deltaproteobacteria bacterium]|nr:class I SAM-dependent methyltransferase [Deltaproteobacteria bacterium]
MAQITDPLRQHDWNSREYVEDWAQRQRRNETLRVRQFELLASLIPFERDAAFRFMDVGCGYGALSKYLMESFPRATAVCHDGSGAMAKLGGERMQELEGRFEYVISDFSKKNWSQEAAGDFDLVVSCNAIHNVRAGEVIQAVYQEIFGRLRDGGRFFNLDRGSATMDDQIAWFKSAGFQDVACHQKSSGLSLYGGSKP